MYKKRIKKIPTKVFLIIIALVYIIPLLIIFTNSFMSQREISRNYGEAYDLFDYGLRGQTHYAEYNLVPENITLDQYNTLLFKTPSYLDLFLNEYVGGVRHLEVERLDTCGGKIRHLRRTDWTLTV